MIRSVSIGELGAAVSLIRQPLVRTAMCALGLETERLIELQRKGSTKSAEMRTYRWDVVVGAGH